VPDNLKMKIFGGKAVESSLEEGDWTPIHLKGEYLPPPTNTLPSSNHQSVSEEIAYVSSTLLFAYTCYNLFPAIPGANSSSSKTLGTSIYSWCITSCNREIVPRHLTCIWSIFIPIKRPGYLGRLWRESDVLFCKL
jgi:hypothetical protein